MQRSVQLDHVLVAGEHKGLFRFTLKPARAVLRVPFVGRGLALRRRRVVAEADLDDARLSPHDSRQCLNRPRQLVMKTRLAVWDQLSAESLHDAKFSGRNDVEAIQE